MQDKIKYFKSKLLKEYFVVYEDGFIVNVKYDSKIKYINISLWKNKDDIKKFSTRGCEKEITKDQFHKATRKSFGENGMYLVKRFEKAINGNKK